MQDCIFCKIISREIQTELILETAKTVAFNDINPVAQIHILIVPRRHIESVLTVDEKNSDDIMDMFTVAQTIVTKRNLTAYKLVFNGGAAQHVPHLHLHLLAGDSVGTPE